MFGVGVGVGVCCVTTRLATTPSFEHGACDPSAARVFGISPCERSATGSTHVERSLRSSRGLTHTRSITTRAIVRRGNVGAFVSWACSFAPLRQHARASRAGGDNKSTHRVYVPLPTPRKHDGEHAGDQQSNNGALRAPSGPAKRTHCRAHASTSNRSHTLAKLMMCGQPSRYIGWYAWRSDECERRGPARWRPRLDIKHTTASRTSRCTKCQYERSIAECVNTSTCTCKLALINQ